MSNDERQNLINEFLDGHIDYLEFRKKVTGWVELDIHVDSEERHEREKQGA